MDNKKRDRCYSSPTGHTPHRRPKRTPLRQVRSNTALCDPRSLPLATAEVPAIQVTTAETNDPSSFATAVHGTTWTDDETRALLEFMLLYRPSDKWPATKNKQFWTSAAEFVELRGNGRIRRSGRVPAPH